MNTNISMKAHSADATDLSAGSEAADRPLTLEFAQQTETVRHCGHYDNLTQTWSDRRFDGVASKKCNEAM